MRPFLDNKAIFNFMIRLNSTITGKYLLITRDESPQIPLRYLLGF